MKKATLDHVLTSVIVILCITMVFLIVCIVKRPRYSQVSETASAVAVSSESDYDDMYADETASEQTSEVATEEEETLMHGKTSTRVNIRDNPSEDAKVLDTVEADTTFEIVEILDNGWTHIIYDDGDAYISSSYVIITD